uniref:Uncharacterized protein n=1 Tax=Rhizophora mucronata TaxID=61149 RepID=A0A2P2II88_RHIMU
MCLPKVPSNLCLAD